MSCLVDQRNVVEVCDRKTGNVLARRNGLSHFRASQICWFKNNQIWITGWRGTNRKASKSIAIKYVLNRGILSQVNIVEAPATTPGPMASASPYNDGQGVVFIANDSNARPPCISFWNSIDKRVVQTPLTFNESHNSHDYVSPDGKTVALMYPGAVSVFDTRTGKRVLQNDELVRRAKSDPFDMDLEWDRKSKTFSVESAGYIQLFRLSPR